VILPTNEFVCFAPSFNGCRQERVSKSEGSSRKSVNHIGIDVGVIAIPVSLKIKSSSKVNSTYSMTR